MRYDEGQRIISHVFRISIIVSNQFFYHFDELRVSFEISLSVESICNSRVLIRMKIKKNKKKKPRENQTVDVARRTWTMAIRTNTSCHIGGGHIIIEPMPPDY